MAETLYENTLVTQFSKCAAGTRNAQFVALFRKTLIPSRDQTWVKKSYTRPRQKSCRQTWRLHIMTDHVTLAISQKCSNPWTCLHQHAATLAKQTLRPIPSKLSHHRKLGLLLACPHGTGTCHWVWQAISVFTEMTLMTQAHNKLLETKIPSYLTFLVCRNMSILVKTSR